jgi:hypothetical protein
MRPADPSLSASIYTARHLDELVRGAVIPFRDALRLRDPEGRWSLWTMRYTRCGPHLKVRLHGPAEERETVRELLAEAVERHFASLGAAAEDEAPRRPRPPATPVDLEDERDEDYPDRTLLWTTYRRSGVSLGPDRVLMADDRYVALFTTALAAGAELVLEALGPGLSEAGRLKALRDGVAAGLSGLPLTDEERAAYLAYHRDWLLRWLMPHGEREAEMLARFDQRAAAMGPAAEEARRVARDGGTGEGAAAWREALSGLAAHLAPLRGDPAHDADPFTRDPVFPPVFKVFHSLANQMGVDMLNEALVHHLLLRALDGAVAPAPALAEA